jgi:hypothetical protein
MTDVIADVTPVGVVALKRGFRVTPKLQATTAELQPPTPELRSTATGAAKCQQ